MAAYSKLPIVAVAFIRMAGINAFWKRVGGYTEEALKLSFHISWFYTVFKLQNVKVFVLAF